MRPRPSPALLAALPAAVLLAVSAPSAAQAPWETWKGPSVLPRLFAGDQVVTRSSFCPSGCAYDRTSEGDGRFLRVEGEEQVVLEETGPGAIVRIWMTAGQGTSEPLDPAVRIRIRLDGAEAPAVDVALPDLFSGRVAPFLPPLVSDRSVSSGGNVSYVPIPYRAGCRVSLVGAGRYKLWFQLDLHRLAEPGAIETFTGREDLSTLARLLSGAGEDPWPGSGETLRGAAEGVPPARLDLFRFEGPGTLTKLRLRLPLPAGEEAVARLAVDGEVRAEMPAADLFALGRGTPLPARSVLVGLDREGWAYLFFPVPFRSAVEVSLRLPETTYPSRWTVEWEARVDRADIPPDAGRFGALLLEASGGAGRDVPLLSADGSGKWVGLFTRLGPGPGAGPGFLEGDERVFVDGSPFPARHGTGVEDLFSGGFYFDRGPFVLPLHGCLERRAGFSAGEEATAYRLFLTDAVPWTSSIRAGLEGGPTGQLPLRARTVAYVYDRAEPGLVPLASVDLGDPPSLSASGYRAEGAAECAPLSSGWPGGGSPVTVTSCRREDGDSSFRLRLPVPGVRGLRLRRRLDAGTPGQEADVFLDGIPAGRFPPVDANPWFRLRDADLDVPLDAVPVSAREVTVTVRPVPRDFSPSFSEVRWELFGALPPVPVAGEGDGAPVSPAPR
ncbi:DUF2961 domain-containing protein [Acidobacteria bacterium ACD]|nr:MAG: DUF2961 domain-containing protein [Acidobacteriota bacterium]MDL1949697.1 DUF2961 domain-containing protein [Acidobacteria bacterium ACD]